MSVTGLKIATALLLMLACGPCSPAAGPPAAKRQMFPDGLEHDFGLVLRGPGLRYSFRIVNTTKRPLQIISLRRT